MKKSLACLIWLCAAILAGNSGISPAAAESTKNLVGFLSGSSILTISQEAEIAQFVNVKNVKRVNCTGSYLVSKSIDKSLATKRAQETCKYVNRVFPNLDTKTKVQITKSKSLSGSVSLKLDFGSSNTTTPFETPFPSKFTRRELIQKALANLASYARAKDSQSEPNILYESTFPNSEKTWAEKMVRRVNQTLPYPTNYKYLVTFGSTDEFAMTEIEKAGLVHPSAGPCNRKTTYESYCASGGWAAFVYKDSLSQGLAITDSGKRSVVAHELFHVWQKTVDGSPIDNNLQPDLPTGIPLWFAEGNANFFGFAFTHISGETSYYDGRFSQVDNYMLTNTKSLKDHVTWGNNPYGIGQASAEYLVASVGVEKVLNVYRLVGKGTTFASAFEQSVGISLESYYQKFDSVQSNFTG